MSRRIVCPGCRRTLTADLGWQHVRKPSRGHKVGGATLLTPVTTEWQFCSPECKDKDAADRAFRLKCQRQQFGPAPDTSDPFIGFREE